MFIISLLFFFIFMLFHGIITFFNIDFAYRIDKIEHFIAGILVSFVIYAFNKKYVKNMISGWPEKIYVLSVTATIGVLWEFYEYFFDILINMPNALPVAQLGNTDTINDLLSDILGAIVFILLIFIFQQKSDLNI